MQRARWEVVLRYRERQRQGCRKVRPGQGARHSRLCPKRLLDREQERESGREVAVEGKPRPAVSAPTKPGAGFYWLAVLWSRGAFAIWVLGNATGPASTGGVFTTRLDP